MEYWMLGVIRRFLLGKDVVVDHKYQGEVRCRIEAVDERGLHVVDEDGNERRLDEAHIKSVRPA
jgi:hypothetical protein